jgi:hypothetical protein
MAPPITGMPSSADGEVTGRWFLRTTLATTVRAGSVPALTGGRTLPERSGRSTTEDVMKPILLLSAVAAIAGASTVATNGTSGERPVARIGRAELEAVPGASTYEVIEALRQTWLRDADAGRVMPAVLIEKRCPEVSCLRWLDAELVHEIRYVPSGGTDTWPAAGRGALVVTLRTREPQTTAAVSP